MAAGNFVGFLNIWGQSERLDLSLYTNPGLWVDLPVAYRQLGVFGCKVTDANAAVKYLACSVADFTARVEAQAQAEGQQSTSYTPTLAASGGGAIAASGLWRAIQRGKLVHIVGQLTFDPAAAGTAETLTFTLPADMQPAAVFGAATDLNGVAMIAGDITATDKVGQPHATVGALTGQIIIDQTDPDVERIGVAFSYTMA